MFKKTDVVSRDEYDGVYVGDMESSVGTVIKVAAVKLHDGFVRGKKPLTPHERKIMRFLYFTSYLLWIMDCPAFWILSTSHAKVNALCLEVLIGMDWSRPETCDY